MDVGNVLIVISWSTRLPRSRLLRSPGAAAPVARIDPSGFDKITGVREGRFGETASGLRNPHTRRHPYPGTSKPHSDDGHRTPEPPHLRNLNEQSVAWATSAGRYLRNPIEVAVALFEGYTTVLRTGFYKQILGQ